MKNRRRSLRTRETVAGKSHKKVILVQVPAEERANPLVA
jgi:hypothetical protein